MRRDVRSTPLTRGASALVAGVGAAAVAGCAKDAPQDTWQPAGDNAQKIQDLQWPVFAIAGVVGRHRRRRRRLWCVFRYRDRGQPIPKQTHGKPALEIGLTILPALILIGVAIPTVGTLIALAKTDDTECVVNVTGQQWWWEFDYPAQDGCGGIEPSRSSPAARWSSRPDTNVLVRGTSRDVIHCFWIPKLNGKRDMVPGRVHTLRLEADEPGIYAGQCTEFCGLSPRQHAHGGRRPRPPPTSRPGRPTSWRRTTAARGGHAGRRGRADVHRPVLALPPGQRPRPTPTATRSSPSPRSTCTPGRRPT